LPHENDENEEGYRIYLEQIVSKIYQELAGKPIGLDFGCGRTTLMEKLFLGKGIEVKSYDIYYHPHESFLEERYDFIIMSEVIEHLREPHRELERLRKCLKPKGKLFIKTCLLPKTFIDFKEWYYKRDITHIQFFSINSLRVLAQRIFLEGPEELGNDLYLFRDNI
jgi:2-polyprenyl-3-methyl-5-hydroxy-6-metoxy-1,4-benzoquinol methylase